jgi:carbon-monoxide dehydrogenase medium subunit
MKPSSFDYHAPESIDEAVALLAELGEGAKVLAGGQSLVPMISLRLAYFDHLVDIGRIDALRGIHAEADTIVIGAATVDAAVEHDLEVAARVPLLARATPFIGHFQIRNRGTLGGSIAHADPAAEYPAIALALDAELEVVSPRGTRVIRAAAFFDGFWTTALASDELLVSVRFPSWRGRTGFAIREFARRFGDFAMAGAVVAVQLDDDNRIARCAIGLLGLGPTPLRATAAENAAIGGSADLSAYELGQLAVSELNEIPSDLHGSARYRRRVGAAMVARAWQEAIEEATRG